VSADHVLQRLAFALRVDEHFSRLPVTEELDLRLDTGEPSVYARNGGHRHDDGTYRWANLTDGLRQISFRSPSGRYVRWDPAPLDVVVPIADPLHAVAIEMWPTPLAAAPAGVTAVRAKLIGTGVAGARVQIDGTGVTPTGRFTFADADGELLYLLPGGPWPFTTTGALDLTITIPGRTVTSVEVRPGPVLFAGAQFAVPPQRETRIRAHVT
jgi:hypothetical protein